MIKIKNIRKLNSYIINIWNILTKKKHLSIISKYKIDKNLFKKKKNKISNLKFKNKILLNSKKNKLKN